MPESANVESTSRAARREATAHRISVCAQVLAEERGLDGFTMHELAEQAGVSRRTLFNYFEGKDAAVLGAKHELDAALLEEFAQSPPTGDLVADVAVLIDRVLEVEDLDREEVARVQGLIAREPRLMALARSRFEEHGTVFQELIRQREGAAYDELRARVVIQTMGSLFDLVLADFVEHPDSNLSQLYAAALDAVRSAFA